jgi:hypothetical protein
MMGVVIIYQEILGGTATSDKIFTISVWVKRTTLGATQQIVNSYDGSTGKR